MEVLSIKESEKTCKICGTIKSVTEFYSQQKKRKDGTEYIYYNPECKECTKVRSMKWEELNKEKFKISKMKYRRTKHGNEMNRLWNKRYVEKGKRQEWINNNKDKLYNYGQNHRTHDIKVIEWEACKQYFNYLCAYCGIHENEAKEKYNNYLHKEHVHHNGANDLSNCIPACKSCNSQKSTHEFEKWFNENNERFTSEKLDKINKWINEDYLKCIQ